MVYNTIINEDQSILVLISGWITTVVDDTCLLTNKESRADHVTQKSNLFTNKNKAGNTKV